jgi:pimeloyl-ACP methyl ester carboxylesterase
VNGALNPNRTIPTRRALLVSVDLDIAVHSVITDRLTVCVRELHGREDGWPVIFLHDELTSSPLFFRAMQAMPEQYRPMAVDLRGYGGTDTVPVDATRGLADFAEDVRATLDALGLAQVHLVGWSMGGGVAMQLVIDDPARALSVTVVNPMSPYGFGGTTGADGRLLSPDGAGSGGGIANAQFVAALNGEDVPEDAPTSPGTVFRTLYVAAGWDSEHEDTYIASMLSTAIGPNNYPGDWVESSTWPGMAPGARGVLNAMAPRHLDLSAFADVDPQPPVLWVRGELDTIVSDNSMLDLAQLGALGVLPGYPGAEVAPPQPMLAQTRSLLDAYASSGGSYREVVMPGVGHSPHIEATEEFCALLADHLAASVPA